MQSKVAEQVREILILNLKNSPYKVAAQACGFSFGEPRVIGFDGCVRASMDFTCVCGRRETFNVNFLTHTNAESMASHTDLIRDLANAGALSKSHLLVDGYSEEDASRIDHTFRVVLGAMMDDERRSQTNQPQRRPYVDANQSRTEIVRNFP